MVMAEEGLTGRRVVVGFWVGGRGSQEEERWRLDVERLALIMPCLAGAGVTIEFVRSPKIRQTLAGLMELV